MTIGNRPPSARADGRNLRDLRPISFQLGVQKWAEGSCLVRFGDTQVLCAATIVDRVPPHLRGKGTGWVTAACFACQTLKRAMASALSSTVSRVRGGGAVVAAASRAFRAAFRSCTYSRTIGPIPLVPATSGFMATPWYVGSR